MRDTVIMAGVVALGLAACSAAPEESATVAAPGDSDRASAGPCPDDAGRLPISGICAGRAANYLNVAGGTVPQPPEGCGWAVQETRFADDLLLFRAVSCAGKATRLAYAKRAGMAELAYESAAYGDPGNALKGDVVVRVVALDPAERIAEVLRTARDAIDDPAERAACTLRNAAIEGWPDDALVVDDPASAAANVANFEPRAACGRFGLDQDASAFWRISQGQGWFFDLGQDTWQVDPGSFTLLTKSPDGGWTQIE